MPDLRSPFCHIVIPAPDLAKAQLFYEQVFGWKVQPNVPGPKYWFFETGNVGGAFNGDKTPAANSVVLILEVDDMEAAVERIVRNGGRIVQEPSRIKKENPGRDAYFTDPNGNELGVYCER